MFRNYLLTAIRNLLSHKLSALINVGGLTVGLTCAILIMLFAREELSYEKWIPDSANLYRLEVTFMLTGRDPWPLASAPFPALRAMQDHIPEVLAATHLVPEAMTVTVGKRQFSESVAVVDPNFFTVIRLPLIAGDAATVFAQPESIVLSKSAALKYFGNEDPVGKIVTVTGEGTICYRDDTACKTTIYPITVTGIMKDLPDNTHLAASMVMSNESRADGLPRSFRDQAWTSTNGSFDYVALAPGTDPDAVLAKFKSVLDQSAKVDEGPLSRIEHYRLTPFWDAHLTSDNYGGMKPPGSRATVYGFLVIAALILLVACVNFTNLATVRATLRAREISLRKVMGARRGQLIAQFLGEALLIALLALILALALTEPLLVLFEHFLDKALNFRYVADWPMLLAIVGIAVAAGLLGGLYPALVLSKFRPATVLRTHTATQSGSGLLRAGLVVLQFAVSIGLGIAAVVVFAQISFARQLDSGFERDSVVVVRGLSKLTTSALESFIAVLRTNPAISELAPSNGVPLDLFNVSNLAIQIEGRPDSFTAHIMSAGPEFPLVYGMPLIAGRLLSRARGEDNFSDYPFYPPDSTPGVDEGRNLLINAEAARRLGLTPGDALGKTLICHGHRATIVGVLANSMLDGARDSVVPTVYAGYGGGNTLLSIRIHGTPTEALRFIDTTWRSFAPGSLIQRYFLTEAFDKQFQADERQGALFGLFVGIAVFIASLGLFGLAAFAAERRTKEIGIRKTFGAKTGHIVQLLLWQFSVPVLLANLIAWPVTYYYLHRWLEGYAYRIVLSPLYFIAAGSAALVIAWATQYTHALRVARANPIHALRHE